MRLEGYDYSRPGAYFVTVCTLRRARLFGWIAAGRMVENGNASIVRRCWLDLPDHYPHVSLDAFVVMPDHIHGIIVLADTNRSGLENWAGLKPAQDPKTRPTPTRSAANLGLPRLAARPLHPKTVQRVPHRAEISAAEEVHVNQQRVEAVKVAARLVEAFVYDPDLFVALEECRAE